MQKSVLITGATSGIGKQLAVDYNDAGWQVLAIGRNQTALAQLADLGIQTAQIELISVDSVVQLQAFIESSTVQLDLAILNAGTCEYIDVDKFDAVVFKQVIDANLVSMGNSIAAILPFLRASQKSKLALMGSTACYLPFTQAQAYGASKAAVKYLSESLRVDLADTAVDVTLVSPGFVDTPLTQKNEFSMPMMVSVEEAARCIRLGLMTKKMEISFPSLFSIILKILNKLPCRVRYWLAREIAKNT